MVQEKLPHQVMEEVFRSGCFYYKWDKPFIRIVDDCVRIYGTPWAGKEAGRIIRMHRLVEFA